ncbi:MAG TPA: AbrB/MazE/SpoVT family DNA-binding domain-containing protein [Desulfohalobiaceae bacterium]|nr:AbrB/MazE/SpoVT family DNA-binding domain-containing protein [Desulfohalobiaceae bacterium]
MAKGDYSHHFDPARLRKLINQGKTASEIMRELKISKWSLKEHLLLLQRQDKQYYEIKELFDQDDRKKQAPAFKQEGLVFSPKMLEKSGFAPGDEFEMIVEKDRIILHKIQK